MNSFLDTSIVIAREFGFQHTKDKIEEALKNTEKFSTSYVKTEINRNFLKDIIYLYSLLIEERDLSEVFKRVKSFPLTPRDRDRCWDILSKITNKGELRLEDSVARLANLITGLHKLLFKDIFLIQSGTECPLADEKIEYLAPIYRISISCTKKSPDCLIQKFMEKNKQNLRNICNYISSDPDFEKLHRLLVKVIENPKKSKGRNCFTLSDIIICLDSPINYAIYSTNIKDFKPICASLGKKFVGLK